MQPLRNRCSRASKPCAQHSLYRGAMQFFKDREELKRNVAFELM